MKTNTPEIKLRLVNNGVFPIINDKFGNPINDSLDTGLNVAGTIQGEGKLVGIPSLIIRTSGCNLRCAWRMEDGTASTCDTAFSSYNPENNTLPISDIITLVKNNIGQIKHVIITGGEPMLQFKQLAALSELLHRVIGVHITLETNGTMFDKDVAAHTNLISLSPKLSSSTPWKPNLRGTAFEFNERYALKHERFRYNIAAIQAWIDSCYGLDPAYYTEIGKHRYNTRQPNKDFQLKFVVCSIEDIDEIKDKYIRLLNGVEPTDIMLMPLGLNQEQLEKTTMLTIRECIKYGWRYTPRLHIDIFNEKRSV